MQMTRVDTLLNTEYNSSTVLHEIYMERKLEENWIVNIFLIIPLSYIILCNLPKFIQQINQALRILDFFSYHYYISHI